MKLRSYWADWNTLYLRRMVLILIVAVSVATVGCATHPMGDVAPDQAAKLDRQLVKDAVVYEPGTRDGAVVPEISAPRLRALFVPEHVEGSRLIEAHREWILEGDVSILGIPKKNEKKK